MHHPPLLRWLAALALAGRRVLGRADLQFLGLGNELEFLLPRDRVDAAAAEDEGGDERE